jgi:hypothetical protein
MKNLMKVLLFAALFAATCAKPLCSNNCGSNDEVQNEIDVLTLVVDVLQNQAVVKLFESFNITTTTTPSPTGPIFPPRIIFNSTNTPLVGISPALIASLLGGK